MDRYPLERVTSPLGEFEIIHQSSDEPFDAKLIDPTVLFMLEQGLITREDIKYQQYDDKKRTAPESKWLQSLRRGESFDIHPKDMDNFIKAAAPSSVIDVRLPEISIAGKLPQKLANEVRVMRSETLYPNGARCLFAALSRRPGCFGITMTSLSPQPKILNDMYCMFYVLVYQLAKPADGITVELLREISAIIRAKFETQTFAATEVAMKLPELCMWLAVYSKSETIARTVYDLISVTNPSIVDEYVADLNMTLGQLELKLRFPDTKSGARLQALADSWIRKINATQVSQTGDLDRLTIMLKVAQTSDLVIQVPDSIAKTLTAMSPMFGAFIASEFKNIPTQSMMLILATLSQNEEIFQCAMNTIMPDLIPKDINMIVVLVIIVLCQLRAIRERHGRVLGDSPPMVILTTLLMYWDTYASQIVLAPEIYTALSAAAAENEAHFASDKIKSL